VIVLLCFVLAGQPRFQRESVRAGQGKENTNTLAVADNPDANWGKGFFLQKEFSSSQGIYK
jgi:hypothetical protein